LRLKAFVRKIGEWNEACRKRERNTPQPLKPARYATARESSKSSIINPEFPTSASEGHTPAAEAREDFLRDLSGKAFNRKAMAKGAKKNSPRVPVETPTPPVLRKKHIGKETLAGGAIPRAFSLPV
jgi:hypothetical protein